MSAAAVAAAVPADVLEQLRRAGLFDEQVQRFLEGDDARKAPGATAAQALKGLCLAGAPSSLIHAYLACGASPRRIVRDLVMHVGPGAKLAGTAATLLQARINAESRITPGSIWADIRAAQAAATRNMMNPRHLQ